MSDEVSDVSGADIESRIMPTTPTYVVKEEITTHIGSSVNIVTGFGISSQALEDSPPKPFPYAPIPQTNNLPGDIDIPDSMT